MDGQRLFRILCFMLFSLEVYEWWTLKSVSDHSGLACRQCDKFRD